MKAPRHPGLLLALMLLAGCAQPEPAPPPAYTAIARDIVEATFSADADALATIHQAAAGRRFTLWAVGADDVRPVRTWGVPADAALGLNLLVSADGRYVVMPYGAPPGLAVVEVATGATRARLPWPAGFGRQGMSAGAFGPDGTVALAGSALSLFDAGTGRRIARAPLPPGLSLDALAFAPDGALLLGAASVREHGRIADRRGILWDGRTLRPVAEFAMRDEAGTVLAWDFLPEHDSLILAATDATLRLMRLPHVVEAARLLPCAAEAPCVWLDPLVAGPKGMVGLGLADVNRARNGFLVFHVDGTTLLPMLEVELYSDVAHAIGVSVTGEWRIAAASGVLRFRPIGEDAVRVERLVVEARRLAEAGFPKAAGEWLLAALALDPERLGERGADTLARDPATAGEIERRREILMRSPDYTAYANSRPLFVYGCLALVAGHPDIAHEAALRLGGDGAVPVQFDSPALALYLRALVMAWRGDVAGAFDLALEARALSNPDIARFLGQRIAAHPAAWRPLLADSVRLAEVTGVPAAVLPAPPDPVPSVPFPRPDGTLVAPVTADAAR